MTFRLPLRLAMLASVVTAACVTDDPLAPVESRLSLEEVLAEFDVPATRLAMGVFTTLGPPPPPVPAACPYETASESFVCAPIAAGGLSLSRSFTLVSATGAKQAVFDKATTSWVRVSSTISGTRAENDFTTVTVDGEQEVIVSGLLTDRHTINGSSSTRLGRVTEGSSSGQPVMTTVTTKLKNVVLPLVPSGAPIAWPLSGSMEILNTTFADYPPPLPGPGPMVSGTVVVFTGTSVVEVALTNRGITRVCRMNMAAVEGVGCPS